MSKRNTILWVAVASVAMLLAACGGGGGSAPTGGLNVTVTHTEFKMDPADINAAPGQTITVTQVNKGSIQHHWVFPAANIQLSMDPGQTVTKTFTAPAAGTYDIYCDVPGHKEAGMSGKFIVK
ncbi:MAG: cupredoxin domain-containing protein [Chloroflexi bacterium]|nr:cupredoxin domain-containing protein [Chloroflexota bacterium]